MHAENAPPKADSPSHDDAMARASEVATHEAGATAAPPWAASVRGQKPGLGRKLMRRIMRTVESWQLIEPGDRIMVAISGGKDSYTLLDLLWQARQRAPFAFDIIAVHLDQVQPGYDGSPMRAWLKEFGAPFEILQEDTYSIVVGNSKPGQAYCFLCSRLRRGILYSAAERLGCNKIALGHHRDDAIETLMMNLFFAGKMQGMPAKYTTDDQRFSVIRPLIECGEKEIQQYAEERGFPIIPCNLCGSQEGLQRDQMRDLLDSLEARIPDVRNVMLQAMRNVRPSHLLDPELAEAWRARPEHIRPWSPGQSKGSGGWDNQPSVVDSNLESFIDRALAPPEGQGEGREARPSSTPDTSASGPARSLVFNGALRIVGGED